MSGQNAPIMQGLFLSTPSARRATSLRLFIVSSLPTFLSTPSARRATGLPLKLLTLDFNFYPRPPRGGRHLRPLECSWVPPISIHALREEGDRCSGDGCCRQFLFLSTPSARRATYVAGGPVCVLLYFYPRPPRGGRRSPASPWMRSQWISIHALREEGDRAMPFFVKTDSLFLSTPSARRATHICVGKRGEVWDFYPRPPRGGRPRPDPLWTGCRRNFYPRPPRGGRLLLAPGYLSTSSNFYPRPPRGGRRSAVRGATWRIFYFYPRPPRGGRPDTDGAQIGFICISIHALREEGDVHTVDPISHFRRFLSTPSARRATFFGSNLFCFCFNFYPRPPRGGRPVLARTLLSITNFYPRPPRGGRHKDREPERDRLEISIHALREEGDSSLWITQPSICYFYPRPPRGGRHGFTPFSSHSFTFLSTPSARRATHLPADGRGDEPISIHALREEGDLLGRVFFLFASEFLSTPSARRATAKTEKNISAFVSL